jgi:hypothetical protein
MTNEQSSIVYLLKNLRDDTTTLVRDEISLAKTEISDKIASTARNVGYLAAGALVAYAALIMILLGITLTASGSLHIGRYEPSKCESARFSHCRDRSRRGWRPPDCQSLEHAEKRTPYSNQNR